MEKYDFSGWVTKANIKCSDGRTIMKGAFKHNDGQSVPLVWNHQHNDPENILGKVLLEHHDEGVYGYASFNDSKKAQTAKLLVQHGDIDAMSIYANQLKEDMSCVTHGNIREVSLVLAGANIGAHIDNIIMHGEESDEEACIFTGEDITLSHSEETIETEETLEHAEDVNKQGETTTVTEEIKHAAEGEETVQDVWDTLSEKQKTVVYAMIGQALEEQQNQKQEGENSEMKHNVFENDTQENTLNHAEIQGKILGDAKRYGSLKESCLQHAGTYGLDNIDVLFPDAQNVNGEPVFVQRDMGWVGKVMAGVHHTPFSRIKSMSADITADAARAKGYMKGNLKKEEVFSLLKRETTPTTVYKKQKLDRDDIVDIKDFDVVAWLKREMRMMLDEELARAFLIGDGRLTSDDDKINELNIKPIATDAELYTVAAQVNVAANAEEADVAKEFINTVIRSRKHYKGSGNPTLFTTQDVVTSILLLEDGFGHKLYKSMGEVATALMVKEIVTVEPMEAETVKGRLGGKLMGVIVNLNDYYVGADKGGAVAMFDDFDIDYNQQKYLIETRCSGALVKPFSAIAVELNRAAE